MELLRKESLAGLPPAAAARVLSHAYAAVVPITPLPYPPLPLAPGRAGAGAGLFGLFGLHQPYSVHMLSHAAVECIALQLYLLQPYAIVYDEFVITVFLGGCVLRAAAVPGVTTSPCLTYPSSRAGPTHFGPSAEAATPWLALALYLALRAGPPSVVLVAGQCLWRLPPQLAACSHALLWPWDLDALRAQARHVNVL